MDVVSAVAGDATKYIQRWLVGNEVALNSLVWNELGGGRGESTIAFGEVAFNVVHPG